MVFDAVHPSFAHSNDDGAGPSTKRNYEYHRDPFEDQHVRQLDDRWTDVVAAADRPLFEGCESHTLLSFVGSLLHIKSQWNLPEAAFNSVNDLIKDILPKGNNCPEIYYQHRKRINDLGLPVEKIDACPNGCMLYWKDHAEDDKCLFSGLDTLMLIDVGDQEEKELRRPF